MNSEKLLRKRIVCVHFIPKVLQLIQSVYFLFHILDIYLLLMMNVQRLFCIKQGKVLVKSQPKLKINIKLKKSTKLCFVYTSKEGFLLQFLSYFCSFDYHSWIGQKLIHFPSIWKLNGAITIIVSSFQPRIYKQHFKSNKNFYVSIKFLLYVFISLTKRNIKNVSGGLKTLGRTWNNTLSPTGSLAFLWDSKCHNTCKKTLAYTSLLYVICI